MAEPLKPRGKAGKPARGGKTPPARTPTPEVGAVPEEENPFADTPTTATSGHSTLLLEERELSAAAEFAGAPASGAYASMTSLPEQVSGPFGGEPPPEAPVASLTEPLPEMAPEIWQAGVRALISVPDAVMPVWPDQPYWAGLAQLYFDELGVADTAARQVELTLAAARVAELAGDAAAALRLCDDALTLAPDAPEALRARGRLAEAAGDLDVAQAAWARLAEVASSEEERAFYAALDAEWTLARRGSLDAAALEAIPDGPARLLAAAEMALLNGAPPEVAAALEQAAFGAGGALGAALLEESARFHEVGGDVATAAEQRFVAARMDPGAAPVPLGRLRDAARQEPRAAEEALAELLPALAPSALGGAVGRWSAALARGRRDPERAQVLLAEGAFGAPSPAAIRDRIDLCVQSGAAPDEATLARARAGLGGTAAAAMLVLVEATALAQAGDVGTALQRLAQGIEEAPDAVPLALLAQEIARASDDPAVRVAGFDLWLRGDPARRAEAALALAEALAALQGAGGGGSELDVRAALQTAIEAAPGAAVFWTTAAHDARAGRIADAAATLGYGAELWGGSRLAPALAERAAELQALAHRRRGEHAPDIATPPAAGAPVDVERRAWSAVQRAIAAAPGARRAAVDDALAVIADHPAALAFLLTDVAAPPDRVASALWEAGASPEAGVMRLVAVLWANLAGDAERALARATALYQADPQWRVARDLLLQSAWASTDADVRARAVALLPSGDDEELATSLRAGAALPDPSRWAQTFAHPEDGETAVAADALDRLRAAATERRWDEAVAILEREPPHETPPSAATLYTAGLLDEGRGAGRRAPSLFVAAEGAGGAGLVCTARAADADADHASRASLLEHAAALSAGEGGDGRDERSRALLLCRAAEERAAAGDAMGAEARFRAAAAADPGSLAAVLGARRAAAARGDVGAAAAASEHEASLLARPEARVKALLLAAGLATQTGDGAGAQARARAVGLLYRALEVDPADEEAFERLRALLEEEGDHAALAALLLGRIAVARNPFELTALRLARAELLGGPLGDRAAAKAELATILQKEPQHPRALARLGDLEYEDGAYADAGELYLRRAFVERSPAELREVFLRLGRIYTRHVPDTKRAVGAYARVVQLEPENHEALAALSDLYVATGEVKNALPVTERLIGIEPEPVRRLAAVIRAGQLWERTGDLRQAGARFRRAADEAPRDVAAVTELARFLERTRDPAGRRALLDHSVGLLRHDVERGRLDLATLRAVSPLLQVRGKTLAAATAAQLLAVVSSDPADREAVAGWAAPPPGGRRLTALARPEIDERSFPPDLPAGVRHVFRLVGALLARGAADLARHGVTRGDRVGRGQPPRDVFDAVATDLGVRDAELFVKAIRAGGAPAPVRVEPGEPPAIIIGTPILDLGAAAVRFAAGRTLRLVSTHLDLIAATSPADGGALLGGVIRQFVPDYRHPEVREPLLELEAERIGKLLSRKQRQEVMPFAIEAAGEFDLEALHAAVRDGANAAGLLASGDLGAALSVVLATAGKPLTLEAIASHAEALSLLRFALSDDYDDMAQAMG